MSFTLNGDNQVRELESERTYNVRDGWKTVRRYRGTKEAVQLFIPTLLVDGVAIRVIPDDGPLATVEAFYDNAQDGSNQTLDAQIVTTWSVASNEIEQSIIETDAFDALNDDSQLAIREYLSGDITHGEAVGRTETPAGDIFLDSIASGKTTIAISQIVLRRTRVISGFDSALTFLSNANKVYSRAQLISTFAPPSGVQSEMPSSGEWLARNGNKEQQSNGKWVLTQEWWHGERISSLYPRVT
mgnify:FL=1